MSLTTDTLTKAPTLIINPSDKINKFCTQIKQKEYLQKIIPLKDNQWKGLKVFGNKT